MRPRRQRVSESHGRLLARVHDRLISCSETRVGCPHSGRHALSLTKQLGPDPLQQTTAVPLTETISMPLCWPRTS
jgi:hypothetical protein